MVFWKLQFNILYITQTVHCNKYRISQTNYMHTLFYTEMFKLHSYMFRTVKMNQLMVRNM
jgi:hypothetical protein